MNYKIEVKSEAESKEAQELFGSLGLTMNGWSAFAFPKYIANFVDGEFSDYSVYDGGLRDWKEITIQELRALVSLHKTPINMDKVLSEVRSDALGLLEDKPMKEYLNKLTDGTYKLVVLSDVIDGHDGLIEIPEGADIYAISKNWKENIFFAKSGGDTLETFNTINKNDWHQESTLTLENLENNYSILWQHHTQPEELPFVDDESSFEKHVKTMKSLMMPCMPKPSLNDQYAEIEQVRQASIADTLNERQSTYGSFEDVALTTQKIMDAIAWAGGQDKLPAPHHEALHMIASKMARIVNGDHNHKDSWHDIAGYATLVERLL